MRVRSITTCEVCNQVLNDEYVEKQSYYDEEQLESKHDSLEDCVKFLSIELARFKTKLINAIK